MGSIDFHEENEFHIRSRRLLGEPETPSMIRFLLRTGVVKNEKQAVSILIGVILVALSATFFIVRGGVGAGGDGYITGLDGVKYSIEEYERLGAQGRDVLNPKTFENNDY